MKKTHLLVIAIIIITISGCSPFRKASKSDITILPLGGEVAVTDGSIVYALPMTIFEIDVIADKTIEVPGPYAEYASELLGLDDVIKEKNEIWALSRVDLNTIEEPDPSQFYVIQGTSIMQTNALALRRSGLILDINSDQYLSRSYSDNRGESNYSGLHFPDMGAEEYVSFKTDTAFKLIKADTAFIRVPYLVEKKRKPSDAEVAESAARKLLELREGKHMLLTGETNVFPQGDAAIEEINRLDKEYTALFAGKRWTEKKLYRFWYIPPQSFSGEKAVLCNFSSLEGVRSAGGETGTPITIEMIPSGKTKELNLVVRPVISEKEISKNDKLFYRVPDVVEIRIISGNEPVCNARKLVYQFGNIVTLPANFIIGK